MCAETEFLFSPFKAALLITGLFPPYWSLVQPPSLRLSSGSLLCVSWMAVPTWGQRMAGWAFCHGIRNTRRAPITALFALNPLQSLASACFQNFITQDLQGLRTVWNVNWTSHFSVRPFSWSYFPMRSMLNTWPRAHLFISLWFWSHLCPDLNIFSHNH